MNIYPILIQWLSNPAQALEGTNSFFFWYFYGLNGLGGWLLFFLLGLAAALWLMYDSQKRRLPAVGWRMGVVGAIVCPLSGILIALGMGSLLGLDDAQFAMLVVFGALPPAVLNYMLAERFNQEPGQVASIVMIGTLASMLVIPAVLVFVL